ncbi:F-box protein SKIP23-like [Silene latifolia]|uniref:F-box protein SKIP23-like n=1 Tax=Silene latifolia TaxID=37657 RepID=UPI003D76D1B4
MAGDWSTMPLDLLGTISMKLETCEDFIYFSLVCRWWNRVASSIKNSWRATPTPWLLLAENNKNNPNCFRKIFNLKNKKCYELTLPETFETRCFGSAYGWVVMIDRRLNVKLFNPISKAHIPFPSLENNIPNLGGYDPEFHKREDYITWCMRCLVEKIVVLKASQSCSHEFVIVAFCAARCIAVARPRDQSWTLILADEGDYEMVDVVVMDDRVFVLYQDGRLVYWNAEEFFNLEFVKQIDYSPRQPHIFGEDLGYTFNKEYLVQSGSELIMVIRYKEEVVDDTGIDFDYDIVYETYRFEVFKLNPTNKLWEKIQELPGLTLLVGCNSSMLVSSGKFLQENSIYFTDDESGFWCIPKEFGGHDMGVFDIKNSEISRFYEGDDTRSIFCPPTLFSPQL